MKGKRLFIKTVRIIFPKKSQQPPYLTNNSWEKEFNYKLWVTKGTRFASAKRCKTLEYNSQVALTCLSSYLIIIGIAPFILDTLSKTIDPSIIALFTTATSILLLGFGLIESSKNYQLRSHEFDQCGTKIAIIYNKLRQAKEYSSEDEIKIIIQDLTTDYDRIISSYPNHESIDFKKFKTQKSKYHNLTICDVIRINISYYRQVHLNYHLLIIMPPAAAILYFLYK
ncbi:MAG: SLATT domain-containing protein [Akkermansiaceae bacterium]